eukprot:143604-Rhodomonas_salina.1
MAAASSGMENFSAAQSSNLVEKVLSFVAVHKLYSVSSTFLQTLAASWMKQYLSTLLTMSD